MSVTQNSSGIAALSYNNSTGVFSYTPPDLSSYLTSESDTLATVTGRGATTSTNSTFSGTLTVGDDFTVDTDTLFVDASSNQIAFGTTTPASNYDLTVKDPNGTASSEQINWKFDVSSAGIVRDVKFEFVGFSTGSLGLSSSSAGGTYLENDTGGCGISAKSNGTVGLYTNGSVTFPDVVLDGSGNLDIGANVIVDGFVEADSYRTASGSTTALTLTSTGGATVGENLTVTGNFTSTGIDDNATSNAVTIDASQNTTFAGQVTATKAVLEGTDDPILTLRSTDDGPLYMEFERGTDRHAYMGFGGSGDTFKIWNEESAGLIQFGTNNTEAIRIDENQDTTFYGKVELSNGASFGLGGQTQFTDFLGGSSDGTSDDGAFSFYGGRTFDAGAGVVLSGDDHATLPNVIRFVNGAFVERARISADGTFVFQNGIEEQQYSLTGTVIDPANGTIQYKTLSASTTFTESLSDGEFVTLMIDDGSNKTVTWPTITWIGGSAPVLQTSGYNVIELWQVNGTLYGAFVGTA